MHSRNDVLVLAAGQPRVRDTKRFQLDLDSFRADIERDHIQTEEWDLRGGGSFVAAGTFDDDANPVGV